MRSTVKSGNIFYDQMTANSNVQKSKKKSYRRASPYDVQNFFNRRTKLNETALENIVSLHNTRGQLPRSVHNKIINPNRKQTQYIKENLVEKNNDSCNRHK
jgi:hypothetical protein